MFRETLPAMVYNGKITTTAMWINLMAGVFFIIAGWRFLLDFYRSGNLEFYLFVYLTLFWGLSCLLFKHATYWSAEWWIFNVLGLSAYLLTLRFVVNNYLNTVFNMRAAFADCKLKNGLLEESEAKYSTLVEQAKDGVFIIQDGICKFANKSMGEITGYPVNELIDMPLSSIVMSECKDLDTQKYKPSCLTNKKVDLAGEMKIRSKDGIIKDTEISTTVIQYNGKTATLGIARDVTVRKKTEQELQKVLKIESISVLAGGIAHDFNNILVSIVGSLSLLRLHIRLHTKSDDKFYEILNRAEKAASRAGDLTRQLLTFSKGGAPIKKIISIPGLIEDTVNFSLKGSKVRCEFFMDNSLWPVEIDDAQISQVINNLIINANQAMPNGGIIKICVKNATVCANDNLPLKEGKYIALSVKDQGIGISQKDLHKIFDPYFTTKEDGSGIGLAVSYSIVKKHEGYMSVSKFMIM